MYMFFFVSCIEFIDPYICSYRKFLEPSDEFDIHSRHFSDKIQKFQIRFRILTGTVPKDLVHRCHFMENDDFFKVCIFVTYYYYH